LGFFRNTPSLFLLAPHKIPHRCPNGPKSGTLFVGLTLGDEIEESFEENARRRRARLRALSREELVAHWAEYNMDYLGGRLTEEDFSGPQLKAMLAVAFAFGDAA
jgi:hypothetical protein